MPPNPRLLAALLFWSCTTVQAQVSAPPALGIPGATPSVVAPPAAAPPAATVPTAPTATPPAAVPGISAPARGPAAAVPRAQPGPPSEPRGLVFSAPPTPQAAGESFSLARLVELARVENPGLNASRAQALAVRAGVQVATAYPNPQIEFLAGDVRARRNVGISGTGTELGVAQLIENPALRRARLAAAEASATGAQASVAVAEAAVLAELRQRYFDVLRAQEEQQAARDDLALAEQILERVRVRVRVGESARFDLIRADTEVAVARRNVATAQARVAQNKALLRLAAAPSVPAEFNVEGQPERPLDPEAIRALRDVMIARNPALQAAQAEVARAGQQVGVEQGLVLPNVGVRLLQTTAPDVNSVQAGVFVNVPVFDRRVGAIRAAREQLSRARLDAEQRRFELAQSFEAALQAYQASSEQLRALEGGVLSGARSALEIAEAAYRFGERGIIEFLDAQRTFRLVRNELIAARFGLQAARIELERLAGQSFDPLAPAAQPVSGGFGP